ncbi:MAG: dihydrolipoyl dehydrogenase [Kiritimatiellae bacterium]|nr:dihydrolipoyl dehydrogenase [Kiritimatiellia bacterium]
MEKFDVVVVGSGPGGYPAAIRAAQLGASVALIEKDVLGGTCLNCGCIPTKALIASSTIFAGIKMAKESGISVKDASFDYSAIVDRKDAVVAKLSGGVAMLLKANGVKVINGTGSFVGRNTLAVDGKPAVEAGRTIISTGSDSVVPGFIPKHKRIVESRAFLEMRDLPESIIVLGGGVIGCEFACMAAQFGSKVTIVEMLDDILMVLDRDIRTGLRRYMEKQLGIQVLTRKPLEKIKADNKGVSGKFAGKTIKADLLLSAVGRRPFADGLELEKVGLKTTDTGHIDVDKHCRTNVATIYAIGDVTAGSTQLAHAATAQGIMAAEDACGHKSATSAQIVPACIFTSPEIGTVGLSEQDAKEQGIDIKVGKFMFAGLGKAIVSGETEGFVKWVCDAATGQLLGGHAIGAHATELVSEAVTAIKAELTAEELGRTIHCHPTFSEAWMEAAHAVHGECIHQPPKRRM